MTTYNSLELSPLTHYEVLDRLEDATHDTALQFRLANAENPHPRDATSAEAAAWRALSPGYATAAANKRALRDSVFTRMGGFLGPDNR